MRLLIAVGLGAFVAVPAAAQEFRATIVGRVIDQQNAAIPGASVEVRRLATGRVHRTETDSEGNYTVAFLDPGRYEVGVEMPGFRRAVQRDVELRVSDRVRLDFRLEVGQMSDSVTVVSEAPLVESDSASQGQVMDNQKVSEYPLNGRNVFMLLDLATG